MSKLRYYGVIRWQHEGATKSRKMTRFYDNRQDAVDALDVILAKLQVKGITEGVVPSICRERRGSVSYAAWALKKRA